MKTKKLFTAKRYYIVLLICVVALSLSFVVSSINNSKKIAELNESFVSYPPIQNVYEPVYEQTYVKPDNYDEYSVSDHQTDINEFEEINEETTEASTDDITSFMYPVAGDVITPHSKDKLIYSKTLDDWRIHEGVDITAEVSSPVYCVYDGTVEETGENEESGIYIIIKHNDTVKTKYSNLEKNDMVNTGDYIKTGDIISEVGNSLMYENGDVSHLHFEVIVNGDSINPLDFLMK